jgi:hypothetical protein
VGSIYVTLTCNETCAVPALVSLGAASVTTKFEGPETWEERGHERAQWATFWVDNHTDAEYWGMIDYDTVFITGVSPRVRGWRCCAASGETVVAEMRIL